MDKWTIKNEGNQIQFNQERKYYITIGDTTLKVTDEGDVTINEKSIENVEECKQAIAMIIKSVCSMV